MATILQQGKSNIISIVHREMRYYRKEVKIDIGFSATQKKKSEIYFYDLTDMVRYI